MVPEAWRSARLSAVDFTPQPRGMFDIPKQCAPSDKDFCFLEDEGSEKGAYVNLLRNPERFTGYAGPSSTQIWKAIYEENCFDLVKQLGAGDEAHSSEDSDDSSLDTDTDQEDSSAPLASASGSLNQTPDILEQNMEKRVFYRIISGLHASISVHICDEYFYRDRGEWGPNLDCFVSRIGRYPERLQNIYFNYVLLLRAITKLSPYLGTYDFCSGEAAEEVKIRTLVKEMVSTSLACPATFDEKVMFSSPHAKVRRKRCVCVCVYVR